MSTAKLLLSNFVCRQVPAEGEQQNVLAVYSRSSTKAVVITVVQEETASETGAP